MAKNKMHPAQPRFARLGGVHNNIFTFETLKKHTIDDPFYRKEAVRLTNLANVLKNKTKNNKPSGEHISLIYSCCTAPGPDSSVIVQPTLNPALT